MSGGFLSQRRYKPTLSAPAKRGSCMGKTVESKASVKALDATDSVLYGGLDGLRGCKAARHVLACMTYNVYQKPPPPLLS